MSCSSLLNCVLLLLSRPRSTFKTNIGKQLREAVQCVLLRDFPPVNKTVTDPSGPPGGPRSPSNPMGSRQGALGVIGVWSCGTSAELIMSSDEQCIACMCTCVGAVNCPIVNALCRADPARTAVRPDIGMRCGACLFVLARPHIFYVVSVDVITTWNRFPWMWSISRACCFSSSRPDVLRRNTYSEIFIYKYISGGESNRIKVPVASISRLIVPEGSQWIPMSPSGVKWSRQSIQSSWELSSTTRAR